MNSKPRIIYIHGDGVLFWSWGWVSKIKASLENNGFRTVFELFPDSIEARAKYWIPFLNKHLRAGLDDVLLGWSCGAVAAIRYAQNHKVKGLVLISPYYTDLGSELVRRSGFVTEPWDWEQIKSNCDQIAIFHSNDDPYIDNREFDYLIQCLNAENIELKGRGHFNEQQEFPELLEYILKNYS